MQNTMQNITPLSIAPVQAGAMFRILHAPKLINILLNNLLLLGIIILISLIIITLLLG